MKTKLIIILGCLSILVSCQSFSYSKWGSCNAETGGCGSFNYCNDCQCADLGYGRNNCISNSKYCEAFGNIGAR
ncbi:MAG: hypothetical protein ACD_46C00524G0006 [uncultured bacterium]|nr:MAG: hypothetical protein ACD_46C00524G0006 [uncultured bacterium]